MASSLSLLSHLLSWWYTYMTDVLWPRWSLQEGLFWSSSCLTVWPLHTSIEHDFIWWWLRSSRLRHIKMSHRDIRHEATTYRIHDRTHPERERGIPASVAPGSRGMKRMGPIHKVPLKQRSYTNRDWHEERRQVVFTYTSSFVSSTQGLCADSVLWK